MLTQGLSQQGDDLQRAQRVSFPFYRNLEHDYTEDKLVFKDKLIQSEQIKPPKYPGSGKSPSIQALCLTTRFPMTKPSPGLTTLNCILTADFRGVSPDKLKKCTRRDGRVYYEVHYTLNVTFDSALMRFSCELDGKEMGAVDAKYG